MCTYIDVSFQDLEEKKVNGSSKINKQALDSSFSTIPVEKSYMFHTSKFNFYFPSISPIRKILLRVDKNV